jgi:hypothetical protein
MPLRPEVYTRRPVTHLDRRQAARLNTRGKPEGGANGKPSLVHFMK